MSDETYFIEKHGVYRHGVFWIGTDRQEGESRLVEWAAQDRDDHHHWNLCQFVPPTDADADADHLVLTQLTGQTKDPDQ